MYNTTLLENTTSVVQMVTALNDISNGFFIGSVVVTIYIIALIGASNMGHFPKTMLVASFGALIITSLAWFQGWVTHYLVWLFMVLLIVSIFIVKFSD